MLTQQDRLLLLVKHMQLQACWTHLLLPEVYARMSDRRLPLLLHISCSQVFTLSSSS